MPDRGAPELADVLDRVRAGDEVDGDRVLLAGDVERRGLAGEPDELLEVRTRHAADVEPGEHGVRQRDEANPEAVAAARGILLDEPGRGEGAELPRHRARREARAPRQLVRAHLAGLGERVEDRDRALRGLDADA
jgi:hypothetical protein